MPGGSEAASAPGSFQAAKGRVTDRPAAPRPTREQRGHLSDAHIQRRGGRTGPKPPSTAASGTETHGNVALSTSSAASHETPQGVT